MAWLDEHIPAGRLTSTYQAEAKRPSNLQLTARMQQVNGWCRSVAYDSGHQITGCLHVTMPTVCPRGALSVGRLGSAELDTGGGG